MEELPKRSEEDSAKILPPEGPKMRESTAEILKRMRADFEARRKATAVKTPAPAVESPAPEEEKAPAITEPEKSKKTRRPKKGKAGTEKSPSEGYSVEMLRDERIKAQEALEKGEITVKEFEKTLRGHLGKMKDLVSEGEVGENKKLVEDLVSEAKAKHPKPAAAEVPTPAEAPAEKKEKTEEEKIYDELLGQYTTGEGSTERQKKLEEMVRQRKFDEEVKGDARYPDTTVYKEVLKKVEYAKSPDGIKHMGPDRAKAMAERWGKFAEYIEASKDAEKPKRTRKSKAVAASVPAEAPAVLDSADIAMQEISEAAAATSKDAIETKIGKGFPRETESPEPGAETPEQPAPVPELFMDWETPTNEEKAAAWWQAKIDSGEAKKEEDFIAEREEAALAGKWREKYETMKGLLSPREQKQLVDLMREQKMISAQGIADLFTAGVSLDDIKNIKHGFLSSKIKSVLSRGEAVPEEEFDARVAARIAGAKKVVGDAVKVEIHNLYENWHDKNISLYTKKLEEYDLAQTQRREAQEAAAAARDAEIAAREERKNTKAAQEQAKIDKAEGMSVEDRMVLVNMLRNRWKDAEKINRALKTGKKIKGGEKLLEQYSAKIIAIAEQLTGKNPIQESLDKVGYHPKTQGRNAVKWERFKMDLTKRVEGIFADQINKIQKQTGKKVKFTNETEAVAPETNPEAITEPGPKYEIGLGEVAETPASEIVTPPPAVETASEPEPAEEKEQEIPLLDFLKGIGKSLNKRKEKVKPSKIPLAGEAPYAIGKMKRAIRRENLRKPERNGGRRKNKK